MTAPSLKTISDEIKKWSDEKLFKEVDRIADFTPEVQDLINQEVNNRKLGCKTIDENPEK